MGFTIKKKLKFKGNRIRVYRYYCLHKFTELRFTKRMDNAARDIKKLSKKERIPQVKKRE